MKHVFCAGVNLSGENRNTAKKCVCYTLVMGLVSSHAES